MWQHGHFYWNELMIRDVEGAKAFYGETLGWTFDAMPMDQGGTYWICKDGDRPVGGIFDMNNQPDFEGHPIQWFSYLAVDDIDARVAQAITAGAKLKQPAMDITGVGRIAVIEDPTGAAIGWMTPVSSD
ncbi:MAG: VOC family protein [Geminicoccaceae bacterium]